MDPCPATACYSRPLTARAIRKVEKTIHLPALVKRNNFPHDAAYGFP